MNDEINRLQQSALEMIAGRDAEIERLRATLSWQPIETAPKDGTAVWVSNGFSMRVAFWANGKEFEHQGSVGGGWRDFFDACEGAAADLMFAPAYWQSLPKSPERSKLDGNDEQRGNADG